MTGIPGTLPETAESIASPQLFPSLLAPLSLGVFLLVSSTTTLIPSLWTFDSKRIIQFGLLLLIFMLPLSNRRINIQLELLLRSVPRWLKRTLLLISGMGVLSAIVNAQSLLHAAASLSEVALLCSLVMVIPVIAACRRVAGRWFDRVAMALLAMTGLAVGIQELIGVLAAHTMGVSFNYDVSLLHFAHPRFYNQVQSWVIPTLAALPLVFSRHRVALLACLLVLGLNWYIILMTGARGSIVSIMTALLFCVVLLPAVRRPLISWQLAGIVLGGLIYAGVLLTFVSPEVPGTPPPSMQAVSPEATGNSGGPDENSSFYRHSLGRSMLDSNGRLWAWKGVLGDARENPALGIGPMNYACVETRWHAHPHNFPLQLAGEWGLPATMAVFIIVFFLFWQLVGTIRREKYDNGYDTVLSGLLFAGLLAAAVHSCFSGVLVMPASQVSGILLGGMLAGLYPLKERSETKGNFRGFAAAGVLVCVALLALGIYELRTMQERDAMKTQAEKMTPRMWQDSRLCRFYNRTNPVTN